MAYQISMIENGRAMLVNNDPDFDFAIHGRAVIGEVLSRLDKLDHPVFYVVDVRQIKMSFDDTTQFINMLTQGDNPLLKHPNIRAIINIVGDSFSRMVSQGMTADAFGNLNIQIVEDMDAALDYIRSQS